MSNHRRRRKKTKRAPMYLDSDRLAEKLEVDENGNGGIQYLDPKEYAVDDLKRTSMGYGVESTNKLLKVRMYLHLGTEDNPIRFKFKAREDSKTGIVKHHLSLQLTGLDLENCQNITGMHKSKVHELLDEREKQIDEFEKKGIDPEEGLEDYISIVPCTRKIEIEMQKTSKRLFKPLAGPVKLDSGDVIHCFKCKIYEPSEYYLNADEKTRKKEKMAKPTVLFYLNEDDDGNEVPEEISVDEYGSYVGRRGYGIFNCSLGPVSKHPKQNSRSYEYGCNAKIHNGIFTEFIENASPLDSLGFGGRKKKKKRKKNGKPFVKRERVVKEGVDANEFITEQGEQEQEQDQGQDQGQGQEDVVVVNGGSGGRSSGKKSSNKRKRNEASPNEYERDPKRQKKGN